MSVVVVWYGLPGSGKSAQLLRLAAAGHLTFDDFMQDPLRHRRGVAASRHFDRILSAVEAVRPCALADIQLCSAAFRAELKKTLMAQVGSLALEWHCFDCRSSEAVALCRDNVRFRMERTARDPRHALAWIDRHAGEFSVEPGASVHAVVRARLADATPAPDGTRPS